MRTFLLAAIVLSLAACGGRGGHGMLVTGDGRFVVNNDTNYRDSVQDAIRTSIDEELGKGWRSEVTVAELPVRVADTSGIEDWQWSTATVQVTLIGPPGAQRTLTDPAIDAAIRDYLKHRVVRRDNIALTITEQREAVTEVAPLVARGSAPTAGPRTYVVQAGDTLADISAVFYGSPQHWRLIQEANPDIPAERLTAPGTAIVIPPAPAK